MAQGLPTNYEAAEWWQRRKRGLLHAAIHNDLCEYVKKPFPENDPQGRLFTHIPLCAK